MKLVYRLIRYYFLEVISFVAGFVIAYTFIDEGLRNETISMAGRKLFLASMALFVAYTFRYIKVGVVEWEGIWRYIYALALLIVVALIFAFG
jgi:hypothetical protein